MKHENLNVYIVGSGPSGVSAAYALLKNGHSVTMLDYANQLSIETNHLKTSFKKKVTTKLVFGDDYPYKNGLEYLNIYTDNCELRPSLAQGGLSSVWGASVLQYLESDIDSWPITLSDLMPHYIEISKFMPISGKIDYLADIPHHRPSVLKN